MHSTELDNIQKIALALIWEFIIKARNLKKTTAHQDFMCSLPPEQYYSEFGSFELNLPRRWGNTIIALELLIRYKSIYVCPNPDLVKVALERVPPHHKKKIFSIEGLLWAARKNKVPKQTELIITDCSRFFPEETLVQLYPLLKPIDPLYIHLGGS